MRTTNYQKQHTDEELMRAYRKSGDNLWLGYLLERYSTLLLGVAMKYLKDRDLAEDAVQQVFLKVLTHLPKEEINNFKGWLYILTRNHCFQELRDRQYHAPQEMLESLERTDEISNKVLEELTLVQLEQTLQELSEEQRITVTLFYLGKKSYEQICTATGYSYQQVKSFIQNGKRNLKQLLLKKMSDIK